MAGGADGRGAVATCRAGLIIKVYDINISFGIFVSMVYTFVVVVNLILWDVPF